MSASDMILFFARDPGGAAAIVPVIAAFRKTHRQFAVYGKDFALRVFERAQISAKALRCTNPHAVGMALDRLNPRFVFTGTSADDMTERWLWRAAADRGIPSAALLDHWSNYGIRFSRYFLNRQAAYDCDRSHPYVPTRIFVMDAYARRCMIRDGIPAEIIAVTGQPSFSTIRDRCLTAARQRSSVRKAWGVRPGERVVLFASEPIIAQMGPAERNRLGYDEKTTLIELREAVNALPSELRSRLRVVVRPHPKENPDVLRRIAQNAAGARIFVSDRFDPAEAITAADAVCGMVSTFLVEAVIAEMPVFSIQPGRRNTYPFILEQRKIVRVARTQQSLRRMLCAAADGSIRLRRPFHLVDRPVDRILEKVDALLCRN